MTGKLSRRGFLRGLAAAGAAAALPQAALPALPAVHDARAVDAMDAGVATTAGFTLMTEVTICGSRYFVPAYDRADST